MTAHDLFQRYDGPNAACLLILTEKIRKGSLLSATVLQFSRTVCSVLQLSSIKFSERYHKLNIEHESEGLEIEKVSTADFLILRVSRLRRLGERS